MHRSLVLVLTMTLFGGGLLLAAPAAAQTGQRCFPETGFCVAGPIRDYWERNGGLPVFGYPITDQRRETVEGRTLPVQWFERDRLEIQADGLVTAGRLGVQRLEQQGIRWQDLPGDNTIIPGCRFFRATQFNLCEPFLSYWERHGGLERFGYPVTRQRSEMLEGRAYTVQYFERRRMEDHPEHAGTAHEVLLGLLGREVLAREAGSGCRYASPTTTRTLAAYAADLGCFRPYNHVSERVDLAVQPFEHGEMIWLPPANGNPGMILVLFRRSGALEGWSWYGDSSVEGEPLPATTPPPGLVAPVRGFGKLWHTVPEVRTALGWATAPEQLSAGEALNHLGRGGFSWAIYRADRDVYYLLRAAGGAAELAPAR